LNSPRECEPARAEEANVSLPGRFRERDQLTNAGRRDARVRGDDVGRAETSDTGVNWFTVFFGSDAVELMRSVWAVGADLATKSAPMRPLAPGRFSTTMGCAQIAASLAP